MAEGVVAIELGDAALAVADGSGLKTVEPGYFVVADGAPRFGTDAVPMLKRYPHLASTRHWRDLTEEPLARPLGGFGSTAAIAAAQLGDLWSRFGTGKAGACLATPPWWGAVQLAILAEHCARLGIPLLGAADAAVAATRSEYVAREVLHLDIGLHSLTTTRMRQSGRASRGEREEFPTLGVESLLRVATETLARRFVACGRFDPLHDAESEQALFDRLPAWLARLGGEGDANLELLTRSGTFTARVPAADFKARLAVAWAPLLQKLRARVAERGPHALLVHARFAEFPGVLEGLLRLPDTVVDVLGPGAAALGLLARRSALPAGPATPLNLVTALPWDRSRTERPAAGPAVSARDNGPTHLLVGDRVHRLGDRPFRIGAEVGDGEAGVALDAGLRGLSRQHCTIRTEHGALTLFDHSRFGTWLNGHRVEGAAILEAGDVISLGSPPVEFRLVTEADPGGA